MSRNVWAMSLFMTAALVHADESNGPLSCLKEGAPLASYVRAYLANQMAADRHPVTERSQELTAAADVCWLRISTDLYKGMDSSKPAERKRYVVQLEYLNRVSQSPVTAGPIAKVLAMAQDYWNKTHGLAFYFKHAGPQTTKAALSQGLYSVVQLLSVTSSHGLRANLPSIFGSMHSTFLRPTVNGSILANPLIDQWVNSRADTPPPAPAHLVQLVFPGVDDNRLLEIEKRSAERELVSRGMATGSAVLASSAVAGLISRSRLPLWARATAYAGDIGLGLAIHHTVSNFVSPDKLRQMDESKLASLLVSESNALLALNDSGKQRLEMYQRSRYITDIAVTLDTDRNMETYQAFRRGKIPAGTFELEPEIARQIARSALNSEISSITRSLESDGLKGAELDGELLNRLNAKIGMLYGKEPIRSLALQYLSIANSSKAGSAQTRLKSMYDVMDRDQDALFKCLLEGPAAALGQKCPGKGILSGPRQARGFSERTEVFALEMTALFRHVEKLTGEGAQKDPLELRNLSNQFIERLVSFSPFFIEVASVQ